MTAAEYLERLDVLVIEAELLGRYLSALPRPLPQGMSPLGLYCQLRAARAVLGEEIVNAAYELLPCLPLEKASCPSR